MGTMASRPASSASFADASVFCHVGRRISGTKLMLGIVFVQKVPSFSLLELKMGFVELLVTRVILPEISRITQSVERTGSDHVATLPADFPRVYIRRNDSLARITESVIHGFQYFLGASATHGQLPKYVERCLPYPTYTQEVATMYADVALKSAAPKKGNLSGQSPADP